jgi:hypothetical protein
MDDRTQDKVVVAYCHPGDVTTSFHESLLDLLVYDMAFHRRIVDGGGRLAKQASANLAGPRNDVVRHFLAASTADWLWFVDADMVFMPDTLERLLEFADPDRAPIVGALCFSIDATMLYPTMYGLVGDENNPQVIRFHEWPVDAMFQVAATGTGCILIHRSVFERVAGYVNPATGQVGFNAAYPWFQETAHANRPVGEDITFCWRAGICGIPVHVNTAVHVGHVKERLLDLDSYLVQRAELGQGVRRDRQGVGV